MLNSDDFEIGHAKASFVFTKVTHPGLLKLSGLREGVYVFQMTVTDTIGQRSSDNVSVTVLAPEHHAEGSKPQTVYSLLLCVCMFKS